jgi:hypothetical protein
MTGAASPESGTASMIFELSLQSRNQRQKNE